MILRGTSGGVEIGGVDKNGKNYKIKSMKALSQILDNLENKPFGFGLFVATFLSIVILRSFLENFAALNIGGYNFFFQWTAGLVHFPLWFLNVFIWTSIIAYLFTKEKIIKIARLMIFSFPIILFPVIIDLMLTAGEGVELSYLFPQSIKELFSQTLYFFTNKNLSIGLRAEIFISSAAVIFYAYRKTKNILKTIGATIIFYTTLIAIHGSLPGIIFIFEKSIRDFSSATDIYSYYGSVLLSNWSMLIGRGYFPVNQAPREFIYGIFNLATALFIFIMLNIGLLLFFYFWDKEKFLAFLKNLRMERLAHYWLMAILGIGISYITFDKLPPFSTFNILSIIVFLLSIVAFRVSAIYFNDINDIKCDFISNPNRPLVSNKISIEDAQNISLSAFLLSLWGASILGYRILLFMLCAHALSFVYSSPPLRLKNLPIVNSFLIAAASLIFTMAGFFMVSSSLEFADFPKKFILLIIICGTLAANLKDVKDIKGDVAVGTKTIPVIFGEKLGKKIIGAFMFCAMIIAPLILNQFWLVPPGLFFGIFVFFAINKDNYHEKTVIAAYFAYLLTISLFYIFYI